MSGGFYPKCPHCRNREHGDYISRCSDCNTFFCTSCSQTEDDELNDDGVFIFLCPNCDSKDSVDVGTILNDDDDDEGYDDDDDNDDDDNDDEDDEDDEDDDDDDELIYCVKCGVTPGERTICINNLQHLFVSTTDYVFCINCGVTPGERTECTGKSGHLFVSKNIFK